MVRILLSGPRVAENVTMYPSIAIAKLALADGALPAIDAIIQDVAMASMSSERNESLNLWRDVEAPGMYLAIASSLEDSLTDHAWDRIELICGSEERFDASLGMADLHPMLPHRIHGQQARKSEVGQLVSISTRRADPGMHEGLLDEMEGIFESLRYIEGYLGSAVGPNAALPEEVIGMVFWSDSQAFDDSGPRKGLYEIRLYQRVL